jgi:PAS domain-containing protein
MTAIRDQEWNPMQTSERQIQERLGMVLQKLARLEHRATAGTESPQVNNLLLDFRRLVGDIERAFSGLQEAGQRHAELQREVEIVARRASLLLQLSPLAYVLIHKTGVIIEANAAAARVLNLSERHLRGKSFELFLQSDRQQFLSRLQALGEDSEAQRWPVTLRPRERYARPFTLIAACETADRVAVIFAGAEGAAAADGVNGHLVEPLGLGDPARRSVAG